MSGLYAAILASATALGCGIRVSYQEWRMRRK